MHEPRDISQKKLNNESKYIFENIRTAEVELEERKKKKKGLNLNSYPLIFRKYFYNIASI